MVEHLDAVAQLHDQPHVVLDDEHAERARVPDRSASAATSSSDSRLVEPGGRLVEEQEARPQGKRACDPERRSSP